MSDLLDHLQSIVRRLRGKDGCPWDQKQTPQSLCKYLLEESSELAEAIAAGDPGHICEEIGDMYFILTLLGEIYREEGTFTPDDSLASIIDKMIRRHPHVFGNAPTGSDEELRRQWEQIKAEEKQAGN